MQSDMVRSTRGCNCTEGELSEALVVEMSGFCEASAMLVVDFVCEYSYYGV